MMLKSWLNTPFNALNERVLNNTLHHGIVLSGERGVFSEELAEQLAASLLCSNTGIEGACGTCKSCLLLASGSHPDYLKVIPEKSIGVDAIREVSNKLSGTSQLSGAKVMVMYDAHSMTESAANALLKTLEEPTDNTYLILLTEKVNSLLPTIASRCEKHSVPTPQKSELNAWLSVEGYENTPDSLLDAYHCIPERVLQALSEPECSYDKFIQDITAFKQGKMSSVAMAQKWETHAIACATWALHLCKINAAQSPSMQILDSYHACRQLFERLNQTGVNKQLQLVSLFRILETVNL
ncbi:DNA polymerase III subunit delta' [Aestuariibacter sp. AA17]|uniref:DNA-directed DNA polymerase n=1 Tax=Fluctibacter corallii TaxID=2984329 RepID=A0ABT3A6N3_9ALTE|nr:DNA polymerase III subunit delta' [Aestuariibacter sp. AA17]MCV2884270.1 DNA polymerase III subunit delta' [Aestuariibacter sp. AA17]